MNGLLDNIPFALLLSLWGIASLLSMLVVHQRWSLKRREEKMPKATEWEDLSARVSILRAEHDDLAPKIEHARELAELAEQAMAKIKAREIRLQGLEARRVELEPLEERLARIDEQLAAKGEDLIVIETDISNKKEEAESLSIQNATLDSALKHKQDEFDKIDTKVSDLIQIESELSSIISANQLQLSDIQKKIEIESENLLQKEQKLHDTLSKYEEAKEQLDDAKEKHSELSGKSRALEKEVEHYQELIKTLKADHAAAGGVQEDDKSLADLWKPIIPIGWPIGGNNDEESRLRGLSQTLNDHGLIFPERVVHAFHTALKVADISPLVLLAGISGTGKSLLPRVYAASMGINFLGKAVQPRWDSPQDMFGFYNYIEHKYKATELSRAMVQFDKFPEDDWRRKEKDNLCDQMLLVLLDEMNLARVEYYFSEFLSKLEVRRDINHQKPDERQKVEISLDVGHGKEVRLFPSWNLVFVGTMNEDESTQSLSDKVLDRSCVLRFGKPRKIQTHRSKTTIENSTGALSAEVWNSWCFNGFQKRSQLVEDTIARLNEIMDSVHRPFGHRVGQAISSYVDNYPQWVAHSEKKALSDQIEQRILPKLRGLDTNEFRQAFDGLKDLVRKLGDENLRKALEKGCEDSGGLETKSFVWNGLDRTDEGLSS